MKTWSRRRVETVFLASLAAATVIPLRFTVESRLWFLSEWACLLAALVCCAVAKSSGEQSQNSSLLTHIAAVWACLTPTTFAIATRQFGSPIAFEMSALATFAAVSLAIAMTASTSRLLSLSLVTSGFLVLFCASISDHQYAAVIPLTWMLGCVWHLIANRWESLDLATPIEVQRNWTLRPAVLLTALTVLAAGGYAANDRWSSSRFANGWMPTSGGHDWSDPAARSGVGSGTAAIAAKDHAESFGAVDTDLFLESTEPSLFDMVNDLIGEPKTKKKTRDRAQALSNENLIKSHERSAKSEQGIATFTTERIPPKKHHHFKDTISDAVIQWDGPRGIRLAMQRYDSFDGREWSQSRDLTNKSLPQINLNEDAWFLDPALQDELDQRQDSLTVGLLKILRLDSPRLPSPMLTTGVHIEKITRQDFFGLSNDGSFYMPGREKVPSLSVVHLANFTLLEDEIRNGLAPITSDAAKSIGTTLPSTVSTSIRKLVDSAKIEFDHPLDQLNACVNKLRAEFSFDRQSNSSAQSIEEFFETRCGGDHLFATTAALMARELGLQSRLVTGFYVRPDAYEHSAGHSSVLPQDVHFWTEIHLADGIWFEIEPSPGFQPPLYKPSLRLRAIRFAAAYWPTMLGAALSAFCLYLSRRIWIDWLLSGTWLFARYLRPRLRYRLALRIIETRARLAGESRPTGKSQRAWLEQLSHRDATLSKATQQFVDAADRLFFGHSNESLDLRDTNLVERLRVRTITALTKEATS